MNNIAVFTLNGTKVDLVRDSVNLIKLWEKAGKYELPVEKIKDLPDVKAIYFVYSNSTILYIGRTNNMKKRWYCHHIFPYVPCNAVVRWILCDEESDVSVIEKALILSESPLLNNKMAKNLPLPGSNGSSSMFFDLLKSNNITLSRAHIIAKQIYGKDARDKVRRLLGDQISSTHEWVLWCNAVIKNRIDSTYSITRLDVENFIAEYINDDLDPSNIYIASVQRARLFWENKGKSPEWISSWLLYMETHRQFIRSLNTSGVTSFREIQACTNEIYKPILGGEAQGIKEERGIKHLRDGLSRVELAAIDLAEAIASESMEQENIQGFSGCRSVCSKSGLKVKRVFE